MLNTVFLGGATSKSIEVRAVTASTGLPKTDLVYNTSGLVANYHRGPNGTVTAITLATQTSTGAYSSGGFVHKDAGVYRLDVPDAAIAAGVDYVVFTLSGVSDCFITSAIVEIAGADPRAARADADVKYWNGSAVATPNVSGVPKVDMTHILGTAGATTELSAIPSATASFWDRITFLFAKSRNKITQTATTSTLYKDDGTTSMGTSTVSDDSTTFTRGKFS